MDPHSVRRNLGNQEFAMLSTEQYLDKLRTMADSSASDQARKQAKEDLFNAHLRLIAKMIGGRSVDIEKSSDLFNSMAARVYAELTDMARVAVQTGTQLSTMIVQRVGRRLADKIRRSTAIQRTPDHDYVEQLRQRVAAGEGSNVLERWILEEASAELRATIDELPETERLVCQALVYGFETGQDMTVSEVARALGIPETTARSAFARAREKLQRRFSDLVQDRES